jgi:gluconokinase
MLEKDVGGRRTDFVTIVVMGVEGSGKTTIGKRLAEKMGWRFVDGDSLHPAANVEKMARGIPLTDEDRQPWLRAIHKLIVEEEKQGRDLIVACSALKQAYRNVLEAGTHIVWVYLKGSPELIRTRLEARRNHFAKSDLLMSQFRDLEEPQDAIVVDVAKTPDEIVAEIVRRVKDVR